MGNGRGRGRLAIGMVVRLNKAVGGVEVGESALIRAVERSGSLLDNKSLLRRFEGGRLGDGLFGVGIGTSDRTIGLDASSAGTRPPFPCTAFFFQRTVRADFSICFEAVKEREVSIKEIKEQECYQDVRVGG